jgi:hypothetical protein
MLGFITKPFLPVGDVVKFRRLGSILSTLISLMSEIKSLTRRLPLMHCLFEKSALKRQSHTGSPIINNYKTMLCSGMPSVSSKAIASASDRECSFKRQF